MEEQNKTVIYLTEDGKTQIDVKFEKRNGVAYTPAIT